MGSKDKMSQIMDEEVKKMLERMEQSTAQKDLTYVESALEQFKQDTGYDFFDVLRSEELQAKIRERDALLTDTDEDTDELMKIYEPWVWRMFMELEDEYEDDDDEE